MNTFQETKYGFDCPLHGIELELFCFRSCEPEHKHRWHIYLTTYEELPITETELQAILSSF